MIILQFDWFLSVLEQKMARKSWYLLHRSCWVGPGISTLRTSPRMEVPLFSTYTVSWMLNPEFQIFNLPLTLFNLCFIFLYGLQIDSNYMIIFFSEICVPLKTLRSKLQFWKFETRHQTKKNAAVRHSELIDILQ